MADYRSFFWEIAAKYMPQAYYVARSSCGGEAIVLAPNEDTARECAVRIWGKDADGMYERKESFTCDKVPVIMCPVDHRVWHGFAEAFPHVHGESEFFGDAEEIRRKVNIGREDAEIRATENPGVR